MCHHNEFRTSWERTDDEEKESTAEPEEPAVEPGFDEAENVEILTDGGDNDDE